MMRHPENFQQTLSDILRRIRRLEARTPGATMAWGKIAADHPDVELRFDPGAFSEPPVLILTVKGGNNAHATITALSAAKATIKVSGHTANAVVHWVALA